MLSLLLPKKKYCCYYYLFRPSKHPKKQCLSELETRRDDWRWTRRVLQTRKDFLGLRSRGRLGEVPTVQGSWYLLLGTQRGQRRWVRDQEARNRFVPTTTMMMMMICSLLS